MRVGGEARDNNGRLPGDERPHGVASAGIAPVPVEEPDVMAVGRSGGRFDGFMKIKQRVTPVLTRNLSNLYRIPDE
jgi:hypothetical protein